MSFLVQNRFNKKTVQAGTAPIVMEEPPSPDNDET